MKNFPLISIIMPAYNSEFTISTAIDSVLCQSYKNFELIIINDYSKDKTGEIAEKYANDDDRIIVLHNEKNLGVSLTRHKAVLKSKGEYLAFLDSDDAWKSNKLELQLNYIEDCKAHFVFTGSEFVKKNKDIDWIFHVPEKIVYKELLKQNRISNSSVLIERQLYIDNEAIGDSMHEDFACWLKVLRTGIIAYGIDEPLLIYRLSENSKSGNKFKAAKMNWKTYRYIGLNCWQSLYYMCWYIINGIMKYRNL